MESLSHIPGPSCKGEPLCSIKIKVKTLPYLVFHIVILYTIPTTQFTPQSSIRRDRLDPYGIMLGKLCFLKRRAGRHSSDRKSWRYRVDPDCIGQGQQTPICKSKYAFLCIYHCPAVIRRKHRTIMKCRQCFYRNRLEQICPMISAFRETQKKVHTYLIQLRHSNQGIYGWILPFAFPCAQRWLRNTQFLRCRRECDFFQFSGQSILAHRKHTLLWSDTGSHSTCLFYALSASTATATPLNST